MIVQLGKIIKCGKKYFADEAYRFGVNSYLGFYNNMPDEEYIKKEFYYKIGEKLDLNNPKTFNEKIQWLKLYDRNPEYIKMVDKYQAKLYVANVLGNQYVIPTLGVWERAEDIEWESLPNQFVLKVTHDSGGLVVCKDKRCLDKKAAIKKLNKSLKQNYYLMHREWPYKDVPKRIIAEKYMSDKSGKSLIDYKVHNFNGVPKMILVCSDRFSDKGLCEDFYDINWKKMNLTRPAYRTSDDKLACPQQLDSMLNLSRKLSEGYPFMRTDFYEIDGKLYFGEITLYPASGLSKYSSKEWDYTLGRWIELPEKEEEIK